MKTAQKEAIEEFCRQYARLRCVYDDYLAFYENGPQRIQLLHEVALHFFARLNLILVQHIELGICRLTDPAGRKRRKNLTVKYILEIIGEEDSDKLGLGELSKPILKMREYVIRGRNKAIAHLDTDALISREIFNKYPREVLDRFWESLGKFVDRVHEHCIGSILGEVVNNRGGSNLVEALKRAIAYNDFFSKNPELWASSVRDERYKDA